jgi:hypothetical protein
MRRLLLLPGILLASITFAQEFTVTPSTLNFGTVNETNIDSLPLTIQNNSNLALTVSGYRFYNTYGAPAFSTTSTQLVIPANSNNTIYIRFHPRHNIAHNTELLIDNDGHRGPLRVDLTGQGTYTNPYYVTTQNLQEEALKLELKSITGNGVFHLDYFTARDSMFMSIDNKKVNGQGATQNSIECIYTGRNAIGYIDRVDCQSNYSFNTEHTFPQGFFNSIEPERSDLHHLFPTDDAANSERSNNPFGIVTSPTWQQGGSKSNGFKFEPRDVQKGKSARAMFYFLTRYVNYAGFVTQTDENYLRQWNTQFPPDAIEINRNQKISTIQFNRNPFVDYPQFVDRINSFIQTSLAPVNYALDLADDTIDFGIANPLTAGDFSFWIVNKGNQPVALNNFNLSNLTTFAFANGTGNNTTLQPGEAVTVDIEIASPPPGIANAFLTFDRTFSTTVQITIPITAQISLTGIDNVSAGTFSVYPNPFTDSFCAATGVGDGQFLLTDITGRIIRISDQNCFYDMEDLPAGMYLLQQISSKQISTVKLVKN